MRELASQDRVGAFALRVEPQAVQFVAEPVANQFETLGEGFDRRAVADDHDLRASRAALHHDLQVTGEPAMDGLGVGRDLRIDQRAPHHGRDAVDQWMLHDAVRDVHHAMRAEFEHAEPGRAQPAANGQAGAQSKA